VLKAVLVLVGFLLARRAMLRIMAATPIEEEEMEAPKPSTAEMRKRQIAEEVENLSQQQPEAVASLLRAWMTESEE